jgi:glucose-6-phosphate 1-dehydrogenase
MARDKFHEEVRTALENDGWLITADPLSFKVGKVQVQIDLGAERLIAAEKGAEKVAIEIKTFGHISFITALYEAVGKYIICRNVLKIIQPERVIYLATPESVYNRFFDEPVLQKMMEEENFKLVVCNQNTQSITKWIR